MTVVTTKEFNANQEKYFDLALNERVFVQKGDNLFFVQGVAQNNEPDMVFEPDNDFYRSVSMEELRASAHDHIQKLFANK